MKVLSIAVILFFSISFAENSTSTNQTRATNEKTAIESDDEELIIGDDEDIQKATKQESVVQDTVKHSIAPAGSATTAKSAPSAATAATAKQATTVNPAASATAGAQIKGDTVDDELKLDGEEESILEPVKQEIVATDTNTNKGSTSGVQAKVIDSAVVSQPADSTNASPTIRGRGYVPPIETAFVKKKAEPQTIGTTGSINFARNLKDYRSPKLAMLMSLIIPGSGQVYAAHHSWKAAIYGAVEVGMVATSAVLRSKGSQKEKDAHKFADQHYDMDKYLRYQSALKNNVDTSTYSNIFFGADSFFSNEAKVKNEGYYDKIKDKDQPFVNGWDDALPGFNDNLEIIDKRYRAVKDSAYLVYLKGTDSTKGYYGFSENQKIYRSMISKKDNDYRKSGAVLAIMLVNHLISAIDAGLTAKAHNDLLLNKKSVWNHIGLEQICLSDGRNLVPGYALKVRF
jgi:hypothetical protein